MIFHIFVCTLNYVLQYIFWLGTLKYTAKAQTVDLLKLNTLRSKKTALKLSKEYDDVLPPK